ncbi:MAG: hypothetical protein US89_C0005G0026 [Candidatus Peregrinibacteria bacterium GW2011_GWF2_38_29]|nr:MAG: hypothetical protein US89_C0005G0026 [Candidatus Peregrinibacteria bacterium GW2011_GWF2_38_29]
MRSARIAPIIICFKRVSSIVTVIYAPITPPIAQIMPKIIAFFSWNFFLRKYMELRPQDL